MTRTSTTFTSIRSSMAGRLGSPIGRIRASIDSCAWGSIRRNGRPRRLLGNGIWNDGAELSKGGLRGRAKHRRASSRERKANGVQTMTLQRLLGIELPIIQAPMAGVQGSAMAVAVSNAGGLGSLPCAMLSLDAIRNELAAIKAQTGKPFNVNFFCHAPPAPSSEREATWRAMLSPYYKEYGIDADTIPVGPGRAPFSSEAADVLDEFKPAGSELSFWFAFGRIAGASESFGREDTLFGNDRRRGALARSTGGRCHHCPRS